ncbi:hypothetical protein [Hyphomonas sp.]|jgi:hypothetical protein|uniref:hypothetical protein n=1 Tax=Hyphomonas sp. TaxID=87 RepID=UPI0025C4964D|nr:hypothetical protein [Hyphomonas sp.]
MMKPIRILGAAVAALAAPALLTLPAVADTRSLATIETRLGDSTTLTLALGSGGYDPYRSRGWDYRHLNYWGQTEREANALRREAVQACAQAVRYESRLLGYYDVDIDDDRRTEQVSRQGFVVHFDDVEFEGRRHNVETWVTCEVRKGRVTEIDGLPRPVKGKPPRRGW